MSSATQNRLIAKLIVGAMAVDNSLDKGSSNKVAQTLLTVGLGELIADIGSVIDDYGSEDINVFQVCKDLQASLGGDAHVLAPLLFRAVVEVVSFDRFVSLNEATYLAAVARRLGIELQQAQGILRQVLSQKRGRIETSGTNIDATISPQLKQFLSFPGADQIAGEVAPDSLAEMVHSAHQLAAEEERIPHDLFERSMVILGLEGNAKISDAEAVWKETIRNLDLPKMAALGETFVSAAIQRITRVNEAYKTVLHYHTQAKSVMAKSIAARSAEAKADPQKK